MGWDYLSRLSRAARWYLPPADAAEVLEDYREIVEGRTEEELRRDLGAPRAVARQLVERKAYRRWLAVFVLLVACVLVPMVMAHNDVYWSPLIRPACVMALCLGSGGSLLWFRRGGTRGGRLPWAILGMLGLILLGMAWAWFLAGLVMTESWELLHVVVESVMAPVSLNECLTLESFAMGIVSVFGLAEARLGDRRWRAVYVLGLSGVILTVSFYLLVTSMNFNGFVPGWNVPYITRYLLITAVGLLGMGLSLR